MTPEEKAHDVDVLTQEHDDAVRKVIKAALVLARAKYANELRNGTVTRLQIIDAAILQYIVPLREKNTENGHNLIFRDADHYFAGWRQEWQRDPKTYDKIPLLPEKAVKAGKDARQGDPKPDPSKRFFSRLGARAYDEIKKYDYSQGKQSTRVDTDPSRPSAAPGGRHWSALSAEHYARDRDTMDRSEAPKLLETTPFEIRAAEEERQREMMERAKEEFRFKQLMMGY